MDIEKSLIIIDDEATLLHLLQDYLEQYGLKVFVYENIPDLEKDLRKKNACFSLDCLMPGFWNRCAEKDKDDRPEDPCYHDDWICR
jgi:FixJ family two-component response regulator